jgi:hypothetical protein
VFVTHCKKLAVRLNGNRDQQKEEHIAGEKERKSAEKTNKEKAA